MEDKLWEDCGVVRGAERGADVGAGDGRGGEAVWW